MGQLVAEETAKRGELQDAQAEEGLKQHEAGGDYDPIVFVWPPTGTSCLLAFFLAVYEFWSLSIRRRSLDFLFDFSGSLELADTRCFAGSKDDCDLLLELEGTPSASSRFLDACFVKVAATCCGGEQLE